MWDNRIFRKVVDGTPYYGVCETYYCKQGVGFTENSMVGWFESVDELKKSVDMIHNDIHRNKPILDWDNKGEQVNDKPTD
jgi:hypothetical protein